LFIIIIYYYYYYNLIGINFASQNDRVIELRFYVPPDTK